MIDPRELRIGNLIYDDEGLSCTVTGLSPHEHLVRCDTEEGCQIIIDFIDIDGSVVSDYVVDSDSAYPIPLTEEWLLKLGFAHGSFGIDRGELSIITKGMDEYYENGRTYFNSWCILEHQPEYVHQLQNLYFALTGEELTIKE